MMLSMEIHKYIKQVRKKLNITQDEYARLLGRSRSTVANYENGNIKPSADVLLKIQELAYNYDVLRGRLGNDMQPAIKN